MNKKTIVFWLIYTVILIFLYILSATDIIIKENEAKVYPISVILDGVSGDNFANMKKGMDEASYEYNVDVSFPVIADNITMEEKFELAEDAIESGAKALIIGNNWKKEIADKIKKSHPDIPVLIVGKTEDGKEEDSICLDYGGIVKSLSESIRSAESINNEICMIAEAFKDEELSEIESGIKARFMEMGYKLKVVTGNGPSLEKQLKAFDYKNTVFISLDKESTVRTVKYADDHNIKAKIYAVGATDYLLGKLEDGEIKGMVAWNEYDMGYFIIEKLIKMFDERKDMKKDKIEVFYITEKELKNEDYIKRLYPING